MTSDSFPWGGSYGSVDPYKGCLFCTGGTVHNGSFHSLGDVPPAGLRCSQSINLRQLGGAPFLEDLCLDLDGRAVLNIIWGGGVVVALFSGLSQLMSH